MSPPVGEATHADLRDIASLFGSESHLSGSALVELEASLRDELERPQTRALVRRSEGGAPFAAILAWHVVDEVTILDVVVAKTRRREGHGAALVTTLLRRATAAGARLGILEVRSGNLAARALYRSLGFEDVRVRRGYYADGEDGVEMHANLLARFAVAE